MTDLGCVCRKKCDEEIVPRIWGGGWVLALALLMAAGCWAGWWWWKGEREGGEHGERDRW